MTLKTAFLLFIALVMVLLSSTYVAKCSRAKPITQHQDNRKAILKADSLQSVLDTRHRKQLDSLKEAYQDTIREAKAKYKVIVQRDVRIEYRHRKAPSLASCDSVIDSKNSRIGELETINTQYHFADLLNDSLITSYQRSIRGKDTTIHKLNAGYEQAIIDLQKAKKPKRFGLGVMAGYGVSANLRAAPMIGVGISYNFIRL